MKMSNRKNISDYPVIHRSTCAALITLSFIANAEEIASQNQPNILFLLSDDAGYNDWGFQGSADFKTPQIDRLANSGVFCTNGYVSASVSGPSRAGLLTGRYQQRFGYFMNPSDTDVLPKTETTIGDALKKLGYYTGVIGKWHMGFPEQYQPNYRGFDYFYGFLSGSRSYYPLPASTNATTLNNNRLRYNKQALDETKMSFYTTDLFTDKAIEFMDESKTQNKPFFLYLSYNAIHGPLNALDADILPYLGLTDQVRRTTGGMTASFDKSVGKLLDYLERNGLRENTLVVWVNDNGGEKSEMHANNWPLRDQKGSEYEGGIRVPFVLSMPNTLPQNQQYNSPVISLDLFPTFVKLAGGDPALNPKILDGVDLMPYLKAEKTDEPHDYLFWQRNNAAVRKGDWKLIELNTKGGIFELYNVKNDIGEKTNQLNNQPTIANELKAKLVEWKQLHNKATALPTTEYDDLYRKVAYPNPFVKTVSFMSNYGHYRILDIAGKELQKGTTTQGLNSLNLDFLSSGTYFLQTIDDEKGKVLKIIKS